MEAWPGANVPELPGHGAETIIVNSSTGNRVAAASSAAATLYVCGITPYDATHIGHAATYLAWDLLVRSWRDAGHSVTYVQNVTDVDDPLLERAARDGEDWRDLAEREIAVFRADMAALRVLPPAHYVGAVEALGEIERLNMTLARHGAVYEVDGDQYFSRNCDPDFGSVAGLGVATMTALAAERGGDPGRPGKKDPLDPVVWLAARPGEPSWTSEFGRGRPGWHVECAAIATHYLGVCFDVQAGGTDLKFPHHEMSASHARVAHGGPVADGRPVFARCYAHSGMVRLGGQKMSKSLGNLVFVSRLLASGVDPMAIRLAILAHHYRTDWDWTDAGLEAAAHRLERWRAAAAAGDATGGAAAGDATGGAAAGADARQADVPEARVPGADVLAALRARLADDLDAPGALAVVDGWAELATGTVRPVGAVGTTAAPTGAAAAAAWLVRDAVDALLGVAL